MVRPQEAEEKESEDTLHQQYEHLQQYWDSIKHSNPRTLRQSSTDTSSIASILQLLNNSPRNLMSSLQHKRSPSERGWRKVRNNDLAVEEILRDRRVAIESGKLKGRRLFEASESATEMGLVWREEICSGRSDLIQESEVRSVSSYASDDENVNDGSKEALPPVCGHCGSCSPSSLSAESMEREKTVVEGEKVEVCLVEKRAGSGVGGNGARWMVVMGWLSIALIVFALGIISKRSFDGHGDADEVILVPT